MKKTFKQFLLAIALIVTLVAISGGEAHAAAEPKLESKKITTFFYKKTTDLIELKNIKDNAKVTVKSSNPKVASAAFYDYKKSDSGWADEKLNPILYGVELNVKKVGTTTITCTVEQGGKTYKLSCVYQVKKYKNPVSSFKIGSVNCASDFNKTDFSEGDQLAKVIEGLAEECKEYDEYGFEEFDEEKFNKLLDKKVQVKVTPKKGYKLKEIWLLADPFFGTATKDKKIKNGSKYSYNMLMDYGTICVELEDKDGDSIFLEMMLPDRTLYSF